LNILGSFPVFSDASIAAILGDIRLMLKSGRLTDGPYLEEFERRFAEYNDVAYAVGVSSGTAALDVTLRHFKLAGREVIVPTNTFISTPNAVIFAGGTPVFADMNPDTLCIDVEDAKRRVTGKTAGVVAVHVAGLVCPQINELKEFCHDRGLFLLEDCAHAHGATANGKKSGSFGEAGCFSFYATKVMTSCEGGMIITNDPAIAEDARCLRNCGQNADRKMVMLGHNWRLSELASIVGLHQFDCLDEAIARRNQIARIYEELLSDVDGVSLFRVPPSFRHSYYKYPIKLADGIDRLKVASIMKESFGVDTGSVYYPPCHLQPYYIDTFGTRLGDFPAAEQVLRRVLCLPMHLGVTDEKARYIAESLVASINTVLAANRKLLVF
jgi:dTDP-4-amino-4,6-dideoxygalactose transaminase